MITVVFALDVPLKVKYLPLMVRHDSYFIYYNSMVILPFDFINNSDLEFMG
jgi:hypothetical protein